MPGKPTRIENSGIVLNNLKLKIRKRKRNYNNK
jgi:hypothetical protein